MLEQVKLALRITTDAYDQELQDLMLAAKQDMGLAGVIVPPQMDPLVSRAVITYCKVHFGDVTDGEFDRLKASYDEQKAQLSMATGYTDWGDGNGIVGRDPSGSGECV